MVWSSRVRAGLATDRQGLAIVKLRWFFPLRGEETAGSFPEELICCGSQVFISGLQVMRKFPSAFVSHITKEGRVVLGLQEMESVGLWQLG